MTRCQRGERYLSVVMGWDLKVVCILKKPERSIYRLNSLWVFLEDFNGLSRASLLVIQLRRITGLSITIAFFAESSSVTHTST